MQPTYAMHPTQAQFRRRQAVALLVATVLLTGLVLTLATVAGRLGGGPLTVSEPRSLGHAALAGHAVHVVQPGDTLWSIARRIQPTGDVRPLVQQLSALRRGAPLQVGERIALPR